LLELEGKEQKGRQDCRPFAFSFVILYFFLRVLGGDVFAVA